MYNIHVYNRVRPSRVSLQDTVENKKYVVTKHEGLKG